MKEFQRIKDENEMFERFFSLNLDLLCIVDLKGTFIKLNKSWESILGYSINELEGRKFIEFVHPEDVEVTLKTCSLLGEQKEIANFVNRYKCIDGTYRYVEWRSQACGDLIYAVARDITEKIKTERAIQEKEENFRTLFETIDDMIFVATTQGMILHTNKAVKEKLGYSDEELSKMQVADLHPDIYKAEAEAIFTDMCKGLREYCPLPIMKRDGSFLFVETKVWLGEWGGIECIYGISKDLSKQQAALEKFHKLFDNNPALMALSNTSDRKIEEINSSYLKKLGYSKDEIIGKTSEELGLFIDVEKHKEVALELLKNRRIKDMDLRVRKKDGSILEGLFSGEIIDNQGKESFLTVMIDITEQKEMERAVKRSEERFKQLAEIFPETIYEADLNGKVTYTNKHAYKQFGYTPNDNYIDINITSFVVHEDRYKLMQGIKDKILGNHRGYVECTAIRKDGTTFPVMEYSSVIKEKDIPVGIRGFILDISEIKKAEEEMHKKERILSAVALSIKELILNRDYYLAISNCFAIIGEATEVDRVYLFKKHYDENGMEMTSQKLEWNSGISKPQIDNPKLQNTPSTYIKSFIEHLKDGKAFYGFVKNLKNDIVREMFQSQSILSIVVLPIFVKEDFWGFIGFDECKYERVWTEDEFSTLSAFVNSMEKAIERSMIEDELEKSRKAAESASVMKGQFLANMSHEIRTPMNGILGFLNLLQSTKLLPEQKEYIREAKTASEMLLHLINDILDLSKIEAGKMVIENTSFKIRTVLENAVSFLLPKAEEKHLGIYTMIKSNVPQEVIGDPARLRQILNNLISNSVKFTEKGEINITVECIEEIDGKALLIFEVRDTGIGISKEEIKKLFRPFTQADASTTRKFGGTGLGLAISKELVRLMGGDISVESEVGKGAVFKFSLLLEISKPAQKYEPFKDISTVLGLKAEIEKEDKVVIRYHAKEQQENLQTKILLVEDNEMNRKIIVTVLKQRKMLCDTAVNGADAVEKVLENNYDIVFMDCQMPLMDGYESTAKIRLLEGTRKHTTIIAMTANAMEGDKEKCIKAGMDDYISKPVDFDIMFNMISANKKNR